MKNETSENYRDLKMRLKIENDKFLRKWENLDEMAKF